MKNYEFHIPFIKSLFLIAFVTIVSMVSARIFLYNSLSDHSNSAQFTSLKSYNEAKAGE